MTREDQLLQEYEDVLFKIMMDRVAQAEGAKLLEENERLLADPEAAVPEMLQKRSKEVIRRAFSGKKQGMVHRSMRKALKVAVLAAILLAVTATVVFAASPAARAKMKNTIRNVYETHTDFVFESDKSHPQELEINAIWLPDGFSIQSEGSISTHAWKNYVNDNGATVNIEKSLPISTAVDTEDATVTSVVVQGFEGTLIEKGDYSTVLWLNTNENVVYYVDGEGISAELLLEIAESFS